MKRTLPVDVPLDLEATVRALEMKAARAARASPRRAWLTGHTPEGPATVHLELDGGRLAAEAWGPGARWRLDSLPQLVGLDDDVESFDPTGIVRQLNRRAAGLRLGRTGTVFETLLPAVLGQRVTGHEAKAAYRGIVRRWGEPAPGPAGALLPPVAEVIASLSHADLHPLGVERSRASILIEVARRARRLEEIVSLDREAAWRRLLAVRGIGPWTAAQAMGIAWGDRDAVMVGDYHLPNDVAWVLAGEPRGTDERMLELLAPFAGVRRRVIVLVKRSGIRPPKYGPRTAIRAIAGI